MAPVAALILIRPRIEVNAIEGDSLNADSNGRHAWPHFPIEAVPVHAEIPRRITQTQKAGHESEIGSLCVAQGFGRLARRGD